ncbi:MAG: SpoIID/LytB protein [Thermoleophilia bacterium]|nr:SpoIID/LytB protein [Thermoleophilia bacterium]
MFHPTRIVRAAVVAASLALLIVTPVSHARSSAQYRVEGRGWGHGIGMSQFGAKGYAQKGWTGEQIIAHYFTGTVIAPKPAGTPDSVRVRLQTGLVTARIEISSSGVVRQGLVTQSLLPSDVVEVTEIDGVELQAAIIRNSVRTVLASGSPAPVTVTPSLDGSLITRFGGEFAASGTRYRGTMTASLVQPGSSHTAANQRVAVVNTVPLESYLRGVISREMSASWELEALRAQAIAARSYALVGIRTGGYFDLYSTTSSQVYGGASAEAANSDNAVASTAGLVARVGDANGKVAQTFFFSTSAGRTANNEDVWTGGTPYTYLRSVPSPFESASPYFTWTYKPGNAGALKIYTPAQLAAKFRGSYAGLFKGVNVALTPSGYAGRVTVLGSKGGSSIGAGTIQANWGLASTYFRIWLLSVNAPNVIHKGQYVTLTGRAPTSGITTLTRTVNGIVAKPIALKVDKATGAWKAPVKVTGTSFVKLTRSGLVGPRLKLAPTAAPTGTTTTISAQSFD